MADAASPSIVVLGAGFAGLNAVRTLTRAGQRLLWIDGRNYHCFLPLLYQVATAGLEPQGIVYPTRAFLPRMHGVDFRLAQIVTADPAARVLVTDRDERIPYDYLIVAVGGSTEDFGVPGVRERTFPLYTLDDARGLRNHLLLSLERALVEPDPQRRDALLCVAIVGAGPTGVETAGALAELRRHVLPNDYPGLAPADFRIVLLEATPDVLGPFPEPLRARARRDLEGFGVEVRTGATVDRISPLGVHLKSGETIPAATVVWAAGIRASAVAGQLGLPTGRSGRIEVEPTLQVVGSPHVYAAGDVALIRGAERLPQVAQVAIQGGRHAAENLLRALRGEAQQPFVYRDKGSMATIGRSRAIAQIGRVHLTGFIAWWAWLVLHLVMLIGFRNRLVVLVNWAWNYVTYDRGLRAIVGREGTEPTRVSR
jgi:NADH dehydrogenase